MNLKLIKVFTIIVSLSVFAFSLTKDAITIDYQGIKTVASYEYFLMGSTALLGGAILEQIIWLANPLCLFAIFLLIKNNKLAQYFSLTALLLAASFSTWNQLLGAESGTMAQIKSLESGYYLWVLSIAILTAGNFLYFKIGGPEIDKKNTYRIKKPTIF